MQKELRSYCSSNSLSEEGLREIIERHGVASKNHTLISDYAFFREACHNEKVTEGIIQYLLEYFPDAAIDSNEGKWTPLHVACNNPNVTLNIIRLLIHAAPDSVHSVNNNGNMPLHYLCWNEQDDEAAAVKMLNFLIEKYHEAVKYVDNDGALPIHIASKWSSPEFCRVLIEAYPGSEQMPDATGRLPLHLACSTNSLKTVEYLYNICPDTINCAARECYPIHFAITGTKYRDNPPTAVEIVQFLLDCDPNQKLIKYRGGSLLQCACSREYNDSNIKAGIQIINVIFDAHPEAIEDYELTSHRYHHQVKAFINRELVFAIQAKDHRLMTTPNANGQLPLHRALQINVRLGSIKLLVKGHPPAIQSPNNSGAVPLHVACMHHDSASVVQYLLELDKATLEAMDSDGNTALHYACRCAKYDTIGLLLDKYDAALVSKRNANGKLPIDLLWESNQVSDWESAEYTGSVFQLVRAYPEMIRTSNLTVKQPVDADVTRHGMKRKFRQDQEM